MTRNRAVACATFSVLAGCAAVPSAPTDSAGAAAETHRYCGDRIESVDGYRCVDEVTSEQQGRRGQTWRFTYRAGRLVRVDHMNGRGVVIEAEHGCATWEARWTDRELAGATCRDHNGVLRSVLQYQAQGTLVSWRDFLGRPLALLGGRAVAIRRAFDVDGRLRAQWTLDAMGTPTQPGLRGVAEVWRRLDARGATIERAHFRGDGRPVRDKAGVHRYSYEVDGTGRVLARRAFDERGLPIADHRHVHLARTSYDAFGNIDRIEWFDSAGRPVREAAEGAAAIVIVRDSGGAEIERRLLDERGQLVEGEDGWAIRRTTVDKRGFSANVTHFGVNDAPMRAVSGAFELKIARDDAGNVTSEETFDVNHAPVDGLDGAARRVTSYDARMHPAHIAYKAGDGTPASSRGGYAALERIFDGDRLVEKRFLDPAGNLVNSTEGVCRAVITYGPDGAESIWTGWTSWPRLPAGAWRDTSDLPQLQVPLPKGAGVLQVTPSPPLVDQTLASSEQVGATRLFAAALSAYALRRLEDAAFLLLAGDLRATADLSRFLPTDRGRNSPAAFDRALFAATSGAIVAAILVRPEALGRVLERLRSYHLRSEASYRPEWEVEAEINRGKWGTQLEVSRLRKIRQLEEMLERVTVPGYLKCLRVITQKNGNPTARISVERAQHAFALLARSGHEASRGAHASARGSEDSCADDDLDPDWIPSLWVNAQGMVMLSKVPLEVDNP